MNLYPYQEDGVRFLAARRRAYLADEMGLGKTVQAIRAAAKLPWGEDQITVVVCPASVVENWKHEWVTWHGPGEVIVTSYSKLIRPAHFQEIAAENPDLVILDEAHYCKSAGAKRTRAALKLARDADVTYLLSGTPMPNDPTELYPVLKILWPELLEEVGVHTKQAFLDRYCVYTETDWGPRIWGLTKLAKAELVPMLRRFMLRRKLAEVALDLPPLRFTVERLPKDPELAAKLLELGADMESDDEHLATIRRVLGSYKAEPIARKLVEELRDSKHKLVVLYHHRKTGEALRRVFMDADYGVVGFDGRAHSSIRQQAIDAFQKPYPSARIFLAQQTAAGVGITLTAASEIVLVEPSWSPADNDQAIKRIHRIGQDKPCRARIFTVPESLDEALMAALHRKQTMIREVLT